MSQIAELIRQYCPHGVAYFSLGDLGKRNHGTSITAAKMKDLNVPGSETRVFAGGGTTADVPVGAIPDSDVIRAPSIVVKSRGYIGFEYYDRPFSHKSELWSYTIKATNVCQKFVYYYLLTQAESLQRVARATSVKIPQLSVADTDNLRIPVPPLQVQRAIVEILDDFTKLEAELEAELEARRKQYTYYRNQLLTSSNSADANTEWSTLGGICLKVGSGGTPLVSRRDFYGGAIPWLRTQEVRFLDIRKTELTITDAGLHGSSAKWIPENCVIVAISGATAGRSAVNKIPLTTNQHCCNLEVDARKADYRYVYYWVASQYENLKALGQGARADLNVSIISGYPIPIPCLPEQERIVSILDNFDALVNDISIGLPAELAARRKQYEYYRDKLLTFKEAA